MDTINFSKQTPTPYREKLKLKPKKETNIGGRPFIIDEDAYLTLRQYLDEVGIRLDGSESSEVMEDIETRIADLFQETLSSRIQVVNLDAVRHAIAILGSAKEFGEPIRQTTPDSVGEQQPPSPTVKKRFYRSRYDRMLGGVCGGIARYYDLDALLVRIITLVLGVFTGLAILPYIILWIVAPMEPRQITEGTDLKDQ